MFLGNIFVTNPSLWLGADGNPFFFSSFPHSLLPFHYLLNFLMSFSQLSLSFVSNFPQVCLRFGFMPLPRLSALCYFVSHPPFLIIHPHPILCSLALNQKWIPNPFSSLTSLPSTDLPNSSRGQVFYDFGQSKCILLAPLASPSTICYFVCIYLLGLAKGTWSGDCFLVWRFRWRNLALVCF